MVQKFKFSLALKARKTSSLHTICILIQNTNQATHCLDFHLSIYFLVKGLDTSNQLQSILTLIEQTIVSAVLGTFSKQQQGALKVSLCIIFYYIYIFIFQSSFNSTEPKKPTKVFIPYQPWREFPEAAKQMIIEYNKKIRVANRRPHFNGGNTIPQSTLGQSNPKPQKVYSHENDHSPDNSSPEASTQAMVHECLSDGRMDPSDISNVMSFFKAKTGNPPQDSSRKTNTYERCVLLELINLPTTWLTGEPIVA